VGSIPKIVSTPLKWASKELLHRTLLRFPGGKTQDPIACTYCPEMCRFSCPTAVVSSNDAVTPCNKMGLLHREERWPGKAAEGGPLWPIYDCTGCGRCTEYCVYEMPVQETLFAARAKHRWDRAEQAAAALTDAADPVGDLAEELGDAPAAARRMRDYLIRQGGPCLVTEPRSLVFLQRMGQEATLDWEGLFTREPAAGLLEALGMKRWLVHESVWLNRHLERFADVRAWGDRLSAAGARLIWPFGHGRDCIDCGGEGAYPLLFGDQAQVMAKEFWERDRHHADGILCFSERCARHLRSALGSSVPVVVAFQISKRGAATR